LSSGESFDSSSASRTCFGSLYSAKRRRVFTPWTIRLTASECSHQQLRPCRHRPALTYGAQIRENFDVRCVPARRRKTRTGREPVGYFSSRHSYSLSCGSMHTNVDLACGAGVLGTKSSLEHPKFIFVSMKRD
jgi:hypothetical protein